MLTIAGRLVFLKEFSENNLCDPKYFGWLRDLESVTMLYHLEYLMPINFQAVEKNVRSVQSSGKDCFIAIYLQDNEEFIGTLKIGHIDWRSGIGDIGIMIGEKQHRGKGISTDVVSTACSYAFNHLSLRKLIAGTPATNIAMRRCFKRVGFEEEGCLRKQLLIGGTYIDHILFGMFKEEANT